jgi:hypothetical protein
VKALLIDLAIFVPIVALVWYLARGVRPPDDE